MKPAIVQRTKLHQGYLTVERLNIRLPDGVEVIREVETHGDAVAVLPYDPEKRVALLVRLFRPPAFDRFGQIALEEACAGMVEGEEPSQAARREALEELGLHLDALEYVGRLWPSPGVSAEQVTLFLAAYAAADRINGGGGVAEEHEGIVVVERPLATLAADADGGRIVDLKLLTLILTLRARHPTLF